MVEQRSALQALVAHLKAEGIEDSRQALQIAVERGWVRRIDCDAIRITRRGMRAAEPRMAYLSSAPASAEPL